MFKPNGIYYEKEIINYPLGKELLDKYTKQNIPMYAIENHNNILEMRQKSNSEFPQLKKNIIIGIRKTHHYIENHKVSDFLVPYTSSGCTAMCLYCYLVCHYNKCSYLRLFVNREQMLEKMIKTAEKSEKNLVFEIGSNSDLILENSITNNLVWTIENFSHAKNGMLTFPTKFDMVDPILNIKGKEKVIIRVSINPEEIIQKVEFGTSHLKNRIQAIKKLKEAGYQVGILIAPIILVDNWEFLYEELIKELANTLDTQTRKDIFFELIFMTYSYVHRMINQEAFPNHIRLFNSNMMSGRGKGKYMYKNEIREEAKQFFLDKMKYYFPNNIILYIV